MISLHLFHHPSGFLWLYCSPTCTAADTALFLHLIKINQSALDGGTESDRRAAEESSRTGLES